MTIGHRIAILNKGDLQQIDTPEEVYNHPANIFVEKFIGTPLMNILTSKIVNEKIYINDTCITDKDNTTPNLDNRNLIYLGIRLEHILVHTENVPKIIQGEVNRIENYGNQKYISVSIGNENIKASIKNDQNITKHQKIYLEMDIGK